MVAGAYELEIEDGIFDVAAYNEETRAMAEQVNRFKETQREAAARWTEGY